WLAWLYRIAHARVVDHYRRSRHQQAQEDIDSLDIAVDHDLDSDLLSSFQQEKLKGALLRLSGEQQQVIILRFIQGYNIQQTADVLGKSIGAIKMIQRRALQAMKAELTRQGMRSDGTD